MLVRRCDYYMALPRKAGDVSISSKAVSSGSDDVMVSNRSVDDSRIMDNGISGSRVEDGDRLKDEITVMMLSDLHFGRDFGKYDCILVELMRDLAHVTQPDMIVLAGDVIDSLDILDNVWAVRVLRNAIFRLAYYAPVYIGIGNHEQCHYDGGILVPSRVDFLRYYCGLKQLELDVSESGLWPIRVLHDTSVMDENTGLRLAGITLPIEYYGLGVEQKYSVEEKDVLKKTLTECKKLGEGTCRKLMLIHSPQYLTTDLLHDVVPSWRNELVISGHMHNGCMPIGLYGLTRRSGRGLIAPDKSLFPRRARCQFPMESTGEMEEEMVYQLTLGSFRAFSNRHKILSALGRVLCPCEVSFLHLREGYGQPMVKRGMFKVN